MFLTEELKDPARDIPRGTIGGMSLVAIVYVRLTLTSQVSSWLVIRP